MAEPNAPGREDAVYNRWNGHGQLPDGQPPGEEDGSDGVGPSPLFESLDQFTAWFLSVYRRSTLGPSRTWCPRWWQHPEAVARLDALWRAFEAARTQPGAAMSSFWGDHADHHMQVLMDPDGPLKGCSLQHGHSQRPLGPLSSDPPPAGMFSTAAAQQDALETVRRLSGLTNPAPVAAADARPEEPVNPWAAPPQSGRA